MKRTYLFLILLLQSSLLYSSSSDNYRSLSYSELFNELINCDEPVYKLQDASIILDPINDRRFYERDSSFVASLDTITIKCQVIFLNVHFGGTEGIIAANELFDVWPTYFYKIKFEKSVSFNRIVAEFDEFASCVFNEKVNFEVCEFGELYITNCVFKGGTSMKYSTFKSAVFIKQCILEKSNDWTDVAEIDRLDFTDNKCDNLTFKRVKMDKFYCKKNSFFGCFSMEICQISQVNIQENNFIANNLEDAINEKTVLITFLTNDNFYWSNNFISNDNYRQGVMITSSIIKEKFTLMNTEFSVPLTLRFLDVKGSALFGKNCRFNSGLFLNEFYFNERSSIAWDNIKGRIRQSDFLDTRPKNLTEDSLELYGLYAPELNNKEYCEQILKTKRTFYTVFKKQGLIQNANEVLVEIKDLETKIWENGYRNEGSMNAYFNWKMNVFLGKFSAYGTNPILAINYSIKVIFFFSIFYLFFKNDWDIGTNKRLSNRFRLMLRYFKLKKGLAEIDKEARLGFKEDIEILNKENSRSLGKVPRFLTWSVKQYVKSNIISEKMRSWVLVKMDVLNGTYVSLTPKKKFRVAFLSSVWLILYTIYFLSVKVLNAFTLSLNAFTTLGFGNIPTSGFPRYIVIIEGFMGWILMTIFSATLITQLLQ